MRPSLIVLILLLCIGSVTAAIVGLQENGHWLGLDDASGAASKNLAPRLARSQSEQGPGEQAPAIEGAQRRAPARRDPHFDIVRINPKGASVFAGRAEAVGSVTVFADGEPIGSSQTDENGEWVLIVERTFASNDPAITLKFKLGAANSNERTPSTVEARAKGSVDGTSSRSSPKLAAATVTADLIDNLRQLVERARARNKDATDSTAPARDQTSTQDRAATGSASERHAITRPSSDPESNDGLPSAHVAARSQLQHKSFQNSTSTTHSGSVPVPIKFVFNEAVLTDDGRQAAQLLIEYVLLEEFKSLKLTGHADERGTHEYNLALSSQRLRTVADMLRAAGYSGEVHLVPMGDTAPFTGVDRNKFSPEALYELDRRVELREAQP